MNREIKVGRKFKMVKHNSKYIIVIDSVINGIVGHHIQDSKKFSGLNCMTCTVREFNGYLRSRALQ